MARVLVIEDTQSDLELMTKVLHEAGHVALTAVTAANGLILARAILPDLIIMNIELPAADSHTVIHRFKDNPGTRYIPLIAITPSGREEAELLAKGYDSALRKPLDADRLREQVQELMQKRDIS